MPEFDGLHKLITPDEAANMINCNSYNPLVLISLDPENTVFINTVKSEFDELVKSWKSGYLLPALYVTEGYKEAILSNFKRIEVGSSCKYVFGGCKKNHSDSTWEMDIENLVSFLVEKYKKNCCRAIYS